MPVCVYVLKGTGICIYEQLKKQLLGYILFQDSDINNDASNSTNFLATKNFSKEYNLSTTISDVQIKRNSMVTLEESHGQGSTVSVSLVNKTVSSVTQNPQDQCWETYVGQVRNCFIMSSTYS